MNDKQAAEKTGRSIAWLRQHECGWCGQNALQAVKGRCGSIWGPKCDPIERAKKPESQQ